MIKKIGFVITIIGALAIAAILFSNRFGIGPRKIHALQWLEVQIGFVVLLVGVALIIAEKNDAFRRLNFTQILKKLPVFFADQPLIFWALPAFLLTYFMFFIAPVFVDSSTQFHYQNGYLPAAPKLGLDLRAIVGHLNLWIIKGKSPYSDHTIFYPPLYNILLAPITLLAYPQSYYLMLALGIFSYIGCTWVVPTLFDGAKKYALPLLFLGSGIFSYGFQLELERGQYTGIAFLFCLLAIYIFHRHYQYRLFAYLFFSIAIQLKVFPVFFVLMFINDFRDWQTNLKRLIGLGLFNFSLLFVLGYSVFVDYVQSTMTQVTEKEAWVWVGNHSIKSFVSLLGKSDQHDGIGLNNDAFLNWVGQNSAFLEGTLLFYGLFCLLVIVVFLYIRKEKGFNPSLLLACTILSMVIPPVSHDYKLIILAAPMAIFLSHLKPMESTWKKLLAGALVFFASFAYSVTLYSYIYRPGFLANSLPFLFIILTIVCILYLLSTWKVDGNRNGAEMMMKN